MQNESLHDSAQASARLLADARAGLQALLDLAREIDPSSESAKNAGLVREHLDEFFLLVVVGEVKSGKSSLINALLGEKVQDVGPLPVTDRIWVLKHGESTAEHVAEEFVREKAHPNPLLQLFSIVDTPGTNSIVRRHQEITESFIPKADLVMFVTSIDRPFSESEHQFLDFVAEQWRRKVIFALTKIDTHPPEDVTEVVAYVKENCRRFWNFEPRVFPLSAVRAREAEERSDDDAREGSGLPALERFLASSLAERERVRLKLSSPAESGLAILKHLEVQLEQRAKLLAEDFAALQDLDGQVRQHTAELRERYHVHVVRLYDQLREFERRGRSFLDATLRAQHFTLLRKPEEFQRRFETAVVADLKDEIESVMHAATDWLVKEQIGLFERSLRFLSNHLATQRHRDRVAAKDPADHGFEYRRDQLVDAMKASFQREIGRFDIPGECRRLTEQAYRSVLTQLGIQGGAIGLGALLVSILSGAAMVTTGLLAAGALFAAGFVIMPRQKKKALADFSAKVDRMIDEFKASLSKHFDAEIDHAAERLRSAWEPYLTFARAETGRIEEWRRRAKETRMKLLEVIEAVGGGEAQDDKEASP